MKYDNWLPVYKRCIAGCTHSVNSLFVVKGMAVWWRKFSKNIFWAKTQLSSLSKVRRCWSVQCIFSCFSHLNIIKWPLKCYWRGHLISLAWPLQHYWRDHCDCYVLRVELSWLLGTTQKDTLNPLPPPSPPSKVWFYKAMRRVLEK